MLKKRERSEEDEFEKINNKKQISEADDFTTFKISGPVAERLKTKGITTLFEVQKAVFSPIYAGKNVMCSALTGSGKTLSFILPVVQKCFDKGRFKHDTPSILVIAPTRELSIQISKEFSDLSTKDFKYNVATIYGGVSVQDQSKNKKNKHI